jgi:[acyl-carrier-protein] S-malonyltransferase
MDQEVKPWRNLALIFPGQGSHSVGMGSELVKVSPAAKAVFDRADEILGWSLSKLCFEGPLPELEHTSKQQSATFVTSIAWLEALKERWAKEGREFAPHVIAGHSMGEFTAAVAAGSLPFEEGLKLVQKRGQLMAEADDEQPGGMASILGLKEAEVLEICEQSGTDGYVGLATVNCEGQNTIAGAIAPLERAMALADKAGARRVIRLPISIASHTPLMAKASAAMDETLQTLTLTAPSVPIVGNINAYVIRTGDELYAELRDQLLSGVYWQKVVEQMQEIGGDMFIETGPGNVLTRIVRRINYDLNSVSISDDHDGMLSENFAALENAMTS